ncbi:MAG TPA: DUF6069 family protein [Pseudonocardiaceae bacterium]|jgi:hypothetical protein|nr:DUF6069 family protein [Pseudonocardiaceae bacterium]
MVMVDTTVSAASRQHAPQLGRIFGAAAVAAVAASLVDALLALIGRSVFSVPATFSQFNPPFYVSLTVFGVIGASVAWAVVTRRAENPVALLRRLALIVVPVTLLADLVLIADHQPPLGAVTLMVMHIGVGVITYMSLTRIAPPRAR